MKLLTKTTLYFLAILVPLLAAAGFYLFKQFSNEINYRSDRELISQELQWIQYLESEADRGTTFYLKTPDLAVYPVKADYTAYPTLTDISAYSKKANGNIPYRQLSQVVSIRGIPYQIVIRQSQEQKAALVTDVTRIMLFVFAGLFAATIFFNWAISNNLWKPFRQSLKKIRSAELQKMETMHFEQTNTKEFNELNTALNYMTGRIYRDYNNMKEFTENAAHEMQTPVAVVKTNLELLLQDNNLTDVQLQSILHSQNTLTRLSKLNEGLLLLAKIDNNQYQTSNAISLAEITRKYLLLFDDIIRAKQLSLRTEYNGEFAVPLHPVLADSLVTNLLGNAIKYNVDGGSIAIKVDDNSYRISNTSSEIPIPADKVFTRLYTSTDKQDGSNGLGLAIVKKIADVSGLRVSYQLHESEHAFELTRV